MGIDSIDADGHGIRIERASQPVAAQVFVKIALRQGIAPLDPATLTDVESIREMVVVRELIFWKANVRRATFGLDVVEPAKVVVAKDFLDLRAFLPIRQHPTRSIAREIPAPVDPQQVKLSVRNDGLGVPVPLILCGVVVRRRFLHSESVIRSAIVFSGETVGERL